MPDYQKPEKNPQLPPPKVQTQEKVLPLSDEDRTKITSDILALQKTPNLPDVVKKSLEAALIFLDPKVNKQISTIDRLVTDLEKTSKDIIQPLTALSKKLKEISDLGLKEEDFSISLKIHVANANKVINKLNDFISKHKNYIKAVGEQDQSVDKAPLMKSWLEFKAAYNKTNEDINKFNADMKNEDKKNKFINELFWHQLGI